MKHVISQSVTIPAQRIIRLNC